MNDPKARDAASKPVELQDEQLADANGGIIAILIGQIVADRSKSPAGPNGVTDGTSNTLMG